MELESPLMLASRTPLEDSFVEISTALSTELSVEALLDHILKEARQFTRAEAGTIFLVDNDHLSCAVACSPGRCRSASRAWPRTSR